MSKEPSGRVLEFLSSLSSALGRRVRVSSYDKEKTYSLVFNVLDTYYNITKSIRVSFLIDLSNFRDAVGEGRIPGSSSFRKIKENLKSKNYLYAGREIRSFFEQINTTSHNMDEFYDELLKTVPAVSSVPKYSTPRVSAGQYREVYRNFFYEEIGSKTTDEDIFDGVALALLVVKEFERKFGNIRSTVGTRGISEYIFNGKRDDMIDMLDEILKMIRASLRNPGDDDEYSKKIEGVVSKMDAILAGFEERARGLHELFKEIVLEMKKFFLD